jgi:hypothetical protein
LLKLEEERSKSLNQTSQRQRSIKRYFDRSETVKKNSEGRTNVTLKQGHGETIDAYKVIRALDCTIHC